MQLNAHSSWTTNYSARCSWSSSRLHQIAAHETPAFPSTILSMYSNASPDGYGTQYMFLFLGWISSLSMADYYFTPARSSTPAWLLYVSARCTVVLVRLSTQ